MVTEFAAGTLKITFANSMDRNKVLTYSRNLPRHIKLDKCVSRRFRNKYKEFRDLGWQLTKAREDIQYRVIFKGHLLMLQVKKRDAEGIKYDWTLQKEWYPPLDYQLEPAVNEKVRTGLTPSTKVVIKDHMIFITGFPADETMGDSLIDKFVELLEQADKDSIQSIEPSGKNCIRVILPTAEQCSNFEKKYKDLKLGNEKLRISILSDKI